MVTPLYTLHVCESACLFQHHCSLDSAPKVCLHRAGGKESSPCFAEQAAELHLFLKLLQVSTVEHQATASLQMIAAIDIDRSAVFSSCGVAAQTCRRCTQQQSACSLDTIMLQLYDTAHAAWSVGFCAACCWPGAGAITVSVLHGKSQCHNRESCTLSDDNMNTSCLVKCNM